MNCDCNYCTASKTKSPTRTELVDRIAKQAVKIVRLRILLLEYINNFDDESISSRNLKNWLDNCWIPAVHKVLEEQ